MPTPRLLLRLMAAVPATAEAESLLKELLPQVVVTWAELQLIDAAS